MRQLLIVLIAAPLVAIGDPIPPGHYLPGGIERGIRERQIDIEGIVADLEVDLEAQSIDGHLAVEFAPLRSGLESVAFDAADLDVREVGGLTESGDAVELDYDLAERDADPNVVVYARNPAATIRAFTQRQE